MPPLVFPISQMQSRGVEDFVIGLLQFRVSVPFFGMHENCAIHGLKNFATQDVLKSSLRKAKLLCEDVERRGHHAGTGTNQNVFERVFPHRRVWSE
jgi:hypothetical protein